MIRLMYQKKKERLYLYDIVKEPVIPYPAYYTLSPMMRKNEMLHEALIAIHMLAFDNYQVPTSFENIFKIFDFGCFAIYKEKYIIGYFGQKLMYLESNGWKGLPATREVFDIENWLCPS